jgi:hypothetical protein
MNCLNSFRPEVFAQMLSTLRINFYGMNKDDLDYIIPTALMPVYAISLILNTWQLTEKESE